MSTRTITLSELNDAHVIVPTSLGIYEIHVYVVDLIKETGFHCEAKASARFNAMDPHTFKVQSDRDVKLTREMWKLADMHQMDRESIEGGYGSHAAWENPYTPPFTGVFELDQV